jgi:hypothetical protein
MTVIIILGGIAFVVAMVVLVVWSKARYDKWMFRDLPELDNSPCLGKMRNWEILAPNGRVVLASPYTGYQDGPMATTQDRWIVVLAPAQARELAGLMRLAAAPGKTLAEAEEALTVEMKRAAQGGPGEKRGQVQKPT